MRESTASLIDSAARSFESGAFEEATRAYDIILLKGLSVTPWRVMNNKGVALRYLKRPREALNAVDESIKCKPDYTNAYLNKALVLTDMREMQAAVATLDALLRLSPGHGTAHRIKVNCLNVLGRHQLAMDALEPALELDPGSVPLHVERALALINMHAGKELRAEIEFFSRAGPLDARTRQIFSIALAEVANNLAHTSDPAAAVSCYDRALAIQPSAAVYYNRGVCLLRTGTKRAALQSFLKAVALDQTERMGQAWAMIGQIRLQLKDFTGAIAAYAKVHFAHPLVYYNLGVATLRAKGPFQRKKREVTALFTQCLKLDPNFVPARDAIAILRESSSEDTTHGVKQVIEP